MIFNATADPNMRGKQKSNMARFTFPYQDILVMITILFLQVCIVPFIVCQQTYSDTEEMANAPYEQLYFKINENMSFHTSLKYPPYRRCIIPEHLSKVSKQNRTARRKKSSSRNWRLYWSNAAWNAYFYENGNELSNWELDKENPDKTASSWYHPLVPILIMIIWIIIAGWMCLFMFPILAMIVFRLLFVIWDFVTNQFVIDVCRWILIKIVKTRRDQVLRVFKNAGHRPPIFRYSLPKFLRHNPYERVPKELDESEDEFWSSDDELNNMGKGFEVGSEYKPTPEFVPEYPGEVAEESQLLSQEMFVYLRRVKQHGMFAVWTDGTDDLNLTGISEKYSRKPHPRTSSFTGELKQIG